MTRSTNMEHVPHLQRMANEAWRGSPEHAALTAAVASLSAPQPPAEPTNRAESSSKLVDGQPPAEAQPDRMAIKLLVAAGFVTEAKANEALNIAHGFDKGPLEPAEAPPCTCPSGDGSLRWPCPVHPPGCGACSDGCVASGLCRVRDESPPIAPDRIVLWSRGVVPNWYFIAKKADRPDIEGAPVYETLDEIILRGSPEAQQPAPSAPLGVEVMALIANMAAYIRAEGGENASPLVAHADRLLAQQPAAVDGDWRKKAAEWLEAKAVQQEAANQKWTEHAACYKEWRDSPGILRYLAIQVLDAQPGGSDNDR